VQRILVTGGAGFIGSYVVDRLLADGARVGVVDDLSTGSAANLRTVATGGRLRAEDIAIMDVCAAECAAWIQRWRPGVVVHLAAQAKVSRSVAAPTHDARVNIMGTLNVLDAAMRTGVDKVVLASSGGTVYGEGRAGDTLPEHGPHRPVSPYGLAKATASRYVELYGSLYGLTTTVLSLGNVYGVRQGTHGSGGVVADFAGALGAGKRPVVYGDGEQTRDFVYVTDVAAAFALAVKKGDGAVLNIGTGIATSVNGLLAMVGDAVGTPVLPEYRAALPGEVRHNALDISRAREVLAWQPRVDLREGVRRAVAEHLSRRSMNQVNGRKEDQA
jgi:UDP-glucose 4-epimerase